MNSESGKLEEIMRRLEDTNKIKDQMIIYALSRKAPKKHIRMDESLESLGYEVKYGGNHE